MIIVKGSIPVKTAHREEALALVQSLAEASREEHGCMAYEVYVRPDAPEVIVIWQQWLDVDALEAHFDSEHVDNFLDAIPDFIEGDVLSQRFDVEAVDGAPLEEAVEINQIHLAGNIVVH